MRKFHLCEDRRPRYQTRTGCQYVTMMIFGDAVTWILSLDGRTDDEWLTSSIRRILIATGLIAKPDYLARLVDDHPIENEIELGVVYVVGGNGFSKVPTSDALRTKLKSFSCLNAESPASLADKIDWLQRPTIHPSVRQTAGSFAHFWITDGCVKIAQTAGRAQINRKTKAKAKSAASLVLKIGLISNQPMR